MGIPGLINAIGAGERISLAKLSIGHLERTARPLRIAVDISIWLFQVQAGRGGRNPELRTLFYRLLKFLALPVHPLFVYDGRQKPPFKRGKAVNSRSYGNAPIIGLSKTLIRLFKFPIHDAPGEAEAECARLQRAGIVDAVMSNDVDALMFGSTFTVMNYSKENGSGTSAATHVTCYRMDSTLPASAVALDRAGMILFAMLSGGDYLPSGVPKCGSKLAAEIARAGFGADLLEALDSDGPELELKLTEWRERLQYELDENESGYFQTKHKAVRIPEDFPNREILSFYAAPIVSNDAEVQLLRHRLKHAWDQEIDTLDIRQFTADAFEWNYRSGARKVVRLLAEPLVSHRLRLRRPVLAFGAPLLSDNQTPVMEKIFKSRASFSTDGQTELQIDMIPIDVVGIDLMAEEPNPPMPSYEVEEANDEEDETEQSAEPIVSAAAKTRVTKRYDPYVPEKIWVFEALAAIGMPKTVDKWRAEQAGKAEKALAPKSSAARKAGPKKKGPIDSAMRHGSILKYGTVTKPRSDMSPPKKAQLLEAAFSSSAEITSSPSSVHGSQGSASSQRNQRNMTSSRKHGHQQHMPLAGHSQHNDLDDLLDRFSTSCSISEKLQTRRRQVRVPASRSAAGLGSSNGGDLATMVTAPVAESTFSPLLLHVGGLRHTSNFGRTIPQSLSCIDGADCSSYSEFEADVALMETFTPLRVRAGGLRLSYSPPIDHPQDRIPCQTSATSNNYDCHNRAQETTARTPSEAPKLPPISARTGIMRLSELARRTHHRTWSNDSDNDLEISSAAALESKSSPPIAAHVGWLRPSYSSGPHAGQSVGEREPAAANADGRRKCARSPRKLAGVRPVEVPTAAVDLDSAMSSLSLRDDTGVHAERESRASNNMKGRRKSPKKVLAVTVAFESTSPRAADMQGSTASSITPPLATVADAPRKSDGTSKKAIKPSVPQAPRPDRNLSPNGDGDAVKVEGYTDYEPKDAHKPTARHIENVTVFDGTWFVDSETPPNDSDTTLGIGDDETKPERGTDVETQNQQGAGSKQKAKKGATKKRIARVSLIDLT